MTLRHAQELTKKRKRKILQIRWKKYSSSILLDYILNRCEDSSDLYHKTQIIKKIYIKQFFQFWLNKTEKAQKAKIDDLKQKWINFSNRILRIQQRVSLLSSKTLSNNKKIQKEKEKKKIQDTSKWMNLIKRVKVKTMHEKLVAYKERLEKIRNTANMKKKWQQMAQRFVLKKKRKEIQAIFYWNIIQTQIIIKIKENIKANNFNRAKLTYKWIVLTRKMQNKIIFNQYQTIIHKEKWILLTESFYHQQKVKILKQCKNRSQWQSLLNYLMLKQNAISAQKMIIDNSRHSNSCWTTIARSFRANSTLALLFKHYPNQHLEYIGYKYGLKAKWCRWCGKYLWNNEINTLEKMSRKLQILRKQWEEKRNNQQQQQQVIPEPSNEIINKVIHYNKNQTIQKEIEIKQLVSLEPNLRMPSTIRIKHPIYVNSGTKPRFHSPEFPPIDYQESLFQSSATQTMPQLKIEDNIEAFSVDSIKQNFSTQTKRRRLKKQSDLSPITVKSNLQNYSTQTNIGFQQQAQLSPITLKSDLHSFSTQANLGLQKQSQVSSITLNSNLHSFTTQTNLGLQQQNQLSPVTVKSELQSYSTQTNLGLHQEKQLSPITLPSDMHSFSTQANLGLQKQSQVSTITLNSNLHSFTTQTNLGLQQQNQLSPVTIHSNMQSFSTQTNMDLKQQGHLNAITIEGSPQANTSAQTSFIKQNLQKDELFSYFVPCDNKEYNIKSSSKPTIHLTYQENEHINAEPNSSLYIIDGNQDLENQENDDDSEVSISNLGDSIVMRHPPTKLSLSPAEITEKNIRNKRHPRKRINTLIEPTSPVPTHSFVSPNRSDSSHAQSFSQYTYENSTFSFSNNSTLQNQSIHVYFDIPSSSISTLLCMSYDGTCEILPTVEEAFSETLQEISCIIPQSNLRFIIENL